jgi:polysaccharide chain length determinant protein (PEP-CTERM system associated)
MLPGRKYTPEDIMRLLTRHKWLIVIPFVVALAIALGAASRISERYRSETMIMVMPQRISTEILPQMVNEQIEDRLPSISDQIMSRSRLERIITDYELYPELRARGAIMEDIVARMRKDIVVGIEGRGKQSFRVSYESESATTAHSVTERLASLYIEENLKDKDSLAQSTSAFLESEIEATRAKMLEAEARLADYKKRHAGQLPSQADSTAQVISTTQMQLAAVSDKINRARERRLLAQQQLADVQATPVLVVPEPASVAGALPTGQTAAQKLDAAEAALALAKQRYTPDHPDVRALERTTRERRAKVEAEAKETPQAKAARPMTAAETQRQRRIRDLEAEIAIVDQQIAAAEREEGTLKAAIAANQANLSAVPTREAELVELNRNYGTLDQSYKELLKKKEVSDFSGNVERRQIGETFRVIDPASMPQRPFNRMRRLQVIAGGAAAGLFLGLGLIGFLEYRDSSFKNEEEVVRLLSLPVLAIVPVMGAVGKPASWWKRGSAVGVIVAAIASAAAIVWRLQS